MNLMRCNECVWFDWDVFTEKQEEVTNNQHFCGLHGRTRVYLGIPQMNLDKRGSCGFRAKHTWRQLELFND